MAGAFKWAVWRNPVAYRRSSRRCQFKSGGVPFLSTAESAYRAGAYPTWVERTICPSAAIHLPSTTMFTPFFILVFIALLLSIGSLIWPKPFLGPIALVLICVALLIGAR